MSTERYEYPEDEFDAAGRERGPRGSHRRPRPLWRTLLPFLVVIIAAPLLAWGAVSVLSGGDGAPQAQDTAGPPAPQTQAPEEDTEAPSEEPAEPETTEAGPTEEETTEEQEPAADVAYDSSISVLNGAGVSGLAGSVVEDLTAEGFTNAAAGNYAAGSPQATTLYYNNASLASTAQAIGAALGITNLVESAQATTAVDIAIVLRGDFAG